MVLFFYVCIQSNSELKCIKVLNIFTNDHLIKSGSPHIVLLIAVRNRLLPNRYKSWSVKVKADLVKQPHSNHCK